MTPQDLDALEKLADALREVSFHNASEAAGYGFASVEGEKRLSADLKALIAELKEARGHLEAMTACSSDYLASGSELARSCKEGMWGELLASARAFLARNGKGEG